MGKKVFGAPWGRSVWATTLVFCGILIAESMLFIIIGLSKLDQSRTMGSVFVGIGVLAALSIFVFALFAPRGYGVAVDGVTVFRWGPNVRIPLGEISEVAEVAPGRSSRTFGVGGLFGFWGMFHSKSIGAFRAYITRKDGLLVIRRKAGAPIVLSPDDPAGFMTAVRDMQAGKKG